MSYWDQELEDTGGGGIASLTGIIDTAYFDDARGFGASLMLKVAFDDPENYPAKTDGAYTMYFKAGADWTTLDGETAIHKDGDESKAYKKNSDIGRLFEYLKNVEGLREAAPDFNPYVAKSYRGLHLTWERTAIKKFLPKKDSAGNTIMKADGKPDFEEQEVSMMLPVALAGSATPEAIDISSLGLTDEQQSALRGAATDDAFMKVLLESGLTSNSAVMALVSKDLKGFRAALAF
jgi:hypothetical protein